MSQKNEAPILILSLLITLGALGGVTWWLMKNPSFQAMLNPGSNTGSSTSSSSTSTSNSTSGNLPAAPSSQASNPSQSSPNSNSQTTGSQATAANTTQNNSQNFDDIQAPAGVFTYGGSTTWAPIRGVVDPVIGQEQSQFQLRYTQHPTKPPGSSTGISRLLDNQLVFSQSSRALKAQEYQEAENKGFKLAEIPVAIDGIAIAVHPDLNISGLTVSQIREIYLGKITNWSEVGGPDLLIQAYSRRLEDGGTVEFFVDNILGGEDFSFTVEFIPTTTQALRAVATNPGGIYYASAPEVVGQCTIQPLPIGLKPDELVPPYQEPRVPPENCPNQRDQLNAAAFQSGTYPITRQLFVIVKQNGQAEQQAGEAYANLLLTDEGQDLIEQSGFVRIR
ncbi:MAG: PstS family phosphate ABC transporter substrate-binding protein [Microcoleaceae cyanobacterium]